MSGSCGWFPMRVEEIEAWVEAHRDELPRTLAELSEFPMPFRKVIVHRATREQRIAFWREHLLTFADPAAQLTESQCAFIAESIEGLPLIYGGTQAEGQVHAAKLEARMAPLFTRAEASQIFGMVGPPEPPGGLPLPPGARPTPSNPA